MLCLLFQPSSRLVLVPPTNIMLNKILFLEMAKMKDSKGLGNHSGTALTQWIYLHLPSFISCSTWFESHFMIYLFVSLIVKLNIKKFYQGCPKKAFTIKVYQSKGILRTTPTQLSILILLSKSHF